MFTYDVFWETLEKRKISQYKLIHTYGVSKGLIYRMKRNESISMYTINSLCDKLECDISDIVRYKRTEVEELV